MIEKPILFSAPMVPGVFFAYAYEPRHGLGEIIQLDFCCTYSKLYDVR